MKNEKEVIGKKGAIQFAALLAVGAFVITGFFAANLFVYDTVYTRAAREKDVVDSINAMEILKRSMHDAVKHTLYTTSKNVLGKGGYSTIPEGTASYECKPYWRQYSDSIEISIAEFELNMEQEFSKVFELFGSEYSDAYKDAESSMKIPDYSECGETDITNNGDTVDAIITGDSCAEGFEIKNGITTVKESNVNFADEDIDSDVFGFFETVSDSFAGNRQILTAVENGVATTECRSIVVEEDECSYTVQKIGDDDTEVGNALIESQCSDWNSRLRHSITNELDKISAGGFDTTFSIEHTNAEYTVGDCTRCEYITSETDNCDDEAEPTEGTLPEGLPITPLVVLEGEEEECVEETIVKYRTTCPYSYNADVDVLVSVQSDSEYPLYNPISDKTEMMKIALEFRILDGNKETLSAKSSVCSD